MCLEDEEVISVGSSAYNLAGDVVNRANFMKNTILSTLFSGASKGGLGNGIIDAHLAGPATSYTRFFKWAETSGYNTQVGNLGGLIYSSRSLSPAGFSYLVPALATHDQRAITFSITALDLHLIALEWIINNTPANRYLTFAATLEKTSGFLGTLTGNVLITYTGGATAVFTPAYNLNNNMPFVYLYHEQRLLSVPEITDTGWITLAAPETPPAKVDFTGTPTIDVVTGSLDKTITTDTSYSNGNPTTHVETTEPVALSFDHVTGTYTKITLIDATASIKGKETTLVQEEESFYNIQYTTEVTTNSVVDPQTVAVSFGSETNKSINSAGVFITLGGSSTTLAIPISAGQTLVASHSPGAGGYNGLFTTTAVIPGSLVTGTDIASRTLSYMAGAVYAYFTYPTATVGFTITRSTPITITTTVTTVTPVVETYWKYKQVTTEITQEKWSPYLLKIYQKGSSSEGDSLLFNTPTSTQKFFPVIPLRRDNVMVDLANFPTQYGWNRKAAKKCFGSKKKYDSLLESLADNPGLGDIDHAWVVFGVSLNTKQQDGQKYLYEFFKNIADTTAIAVGTYKSPTAYADAWATFVSAAQVSTNDESGVDIPTRPIPPVAQEYTTTINSSGAVQNWLFNITITAKGGGQVIGSGYHAKSLGKIGHCWVYAKSTITLSVPSYTNDVELSFIPATTTVIAFGKQVAADTWVEYEFFDLVHVNNVYQGVTTTTLGTTAIASTEENSSFIIPLHEGVFTELTLIRRTQLSLECAFIVVNYYNKQTIPWYSTGFFQIIVVVAIIVIAVYTGYIGPEAAGVLGTNATVGATLGFVGTAAIAGAIANAVAAAIVSALIVRVSKAALGEEVGRIVGLIASMITINLMSSGDKAFSLADSWTQMTKADNLIKLSLSGINEYGSYLQGKVAEISAETQALMLESEKSLKDIQRLTQELLGDSGINPTTITDAIRYATENPEQFLDRTTMTGTEIAELSLKFVENFPAPQLALPYLD
jgi:hypothetical protein